jgi:hypothetical protein
MADPARGRDLAAVRGVPEKARDRADVRNDLARGDSLEVDRRTLREAPSEALREEKGRRARNGQVVAHEGRPLRDEQIEKRAPKTGNVRVNARAGAEENVRSVVDDREDEPGKAGRVDNRRRDVRQKAKKRRKDAKLRRIALNTNAMPDHSVEERNHTSFLALTNPFFEKQTARVDIPREELPAVRKGLKVAVPQSRKREWKPLRFTLKELEGKRRDCLGNIALEFGLICPENMEITIRDQRFEKCRANITKSLLNAL